MIKDIASRLPAKPVHLYAEFVSSNTDDEGKTCGNVILHIELENTTHTLPLQFVTPGGESYPAVICLEDGGAVNALFDDEAAFDDRHSRIQRGKGVAPDGSHVFGGAEFADRQGADRRG